MPRSPRSTRKLPEAAPEDVRTITEATLEMVGRQCPLEAYQKVRVRPVQVQSDLIAYASPDSTYAVTKRLFDAAERSILIGIYDFTAGYVKELLVAAMRRGVKVSLMLDLDGRTGEDDLFEDLSRHGAECVPAPSCASKRVHFFASSHEKVVVIDDEWTLVQSGNYSENSIPLNEKDGGDPSRFTPGNRDMGVAVRSRPLARFFTDILRADIRLEQDAPPPTEAVPVGPFDAPMAEVMVPAPPQVPRELFRSRRFNPTNPVSVLPVLSPDNYLDVVPGLLAGASRSIEIEEQYIRSAQPKIVTLLAAIAEARTAHPDLAVRIVLAAPFPSKDAFDKEAKEIVELARSFGLKLDTNVRILNPEFFVHCHNKLIIIDARSVLVSSQNWSDSAVSLNREAGLLIEYPALARYYRRIFELDWRTGLTKLERRRAPLLAPESLATGTVVPVNLGDYADV